MKVLLILIILSLAMFADSTKSWKSLPTSTIAAIEMDFSEDLLLKLRNETSLGKTILSEKNIASFVEIVKKHSLINPKLAATLAELRSSGFTIDELANILNSKLGMALVPENNNDKAYWSVLAWSEMRDGLAAKIVNSLSERKQGKEIDLNGHKGLAFQNDWETSYTILSAHKNSLIMVSSDVDTEHKNNLGAKKNKNSKLKLGFHPSKLNDFSSQHICFERFSSFLNSHSGSGDSKFLAKLNDNEFHHKMTHSGQRVIEYHVDFGIFKKFLDSNMKRFEMTGFSKLKHASGIVSYGSKFIKSKFFIETDSPRTSLLKLLDQPKISLETEDWVTDDVNSYSHISMDVNFIYQQIKEMLSSQFGKAAVSQKLKEADMHCRAFIGHSIKSILDGFGDKITFLDYGLSLKPHEVQYVLTPNIAMIIPFKNKSVSNRVIEILTPFAAAKGIYRNDQEGFKGFLSEEIDASLHIGEEKIIFTSGENVCQKVLGSISSPSKNKLSDNPQFKKFIELLDVKETTMLSYGNLKSSIGEFYELIEMAIEHKKILSGMEKRDKAFIQELLQNLPTVEDITDVLGVGGAYGVPEKDGFFIKGLVELP